MSRHHNRRDGGVSAPAITASDPNSDLLVRVDNSMRRQIVDRRRIPRLHALLQESEERVG